MKHKTLVGGLGTSSILRYSDEAQTYEIYSPWKNGVGKMRFKRTVDTVAYADLVGYTTFVEPDQGRKSGLGRAAGLGIFFGPAGAIVGAITGRREFETIRQISIALATASGDYYTIPLLYAELKPEKAASTAAKSAMIQLEKVTSKLEATGAQFDSNLSARI